MRIKTKPLIGWVLLLLLCGTLPLHAQRDQKPYEKALTELNQLRKEVLATGFQKEAPELFAQAEKSKNEALKLLKKGDSRKAQALVKEAAKNYREVVVQGLLSGPILQAEKELQAWQRKADPGVYKEAESSLAALKREVRGSSGRDFVISKYVTEIEASIGDLLGKLYPPVKRPDTLFIGGFTMVVERYDKLGTYYSHAHRFAGLEGLGRIKFDCAPQFIFPLFPIWKGAIMKDYQFKIVTEVKDPIREISLKDALLADPKAKLGTEMKILLPEARGKYLDIGKSKIDWIDWLKPKPDGIRVHFKDLAVTAIGSGVTGTVTAGLATYPSDPPVPVPPITLKVNGFDLKIDSLTIDKDKAMAEGRLILPNSLTAGVHCEAASLNLGSFQISPTCEFYVVKADSMYSMTVGNTTLEIGGKGFVADFRSNLSYAPSGKPASWKGVWLFAGQSKKAPSGSVTSNTGYLKAGYFFPHAEVTSAGLKANMEHAGNYSFHAIQPFGYDISFSKASLVISGSKVQSGILDTGEILFPKFAARDVSDNRLKATFNSLEVQNDMDLYGNVNLVGKQIHWGDWVHGGKEIRAFSSDKVESGNAYFSAVMREPYMPAVGNAFVEPNLSPPNTQLEALGMQGVTFGSIRDLSIYTPDIPAGDPPLNFVLLASHPNWINIVTRGVHASLGSRTEITQTVKLGPTNDPRYVGKKPFETTFGAPKEQKEEPYLELQFVESAAFNSDFDGFVRLKGPANIELDFTEMVFTSTAHNAGGQVDLTTPDTLAYWGVVPVPKAGFSSAGLVSVKSGQVILTAAGLDESIHWAEPFYLTWGEMLASGELGRLFFDYNSAGQEFDGFDYVTGAVALSAWEPAINPQGFLHAGGNIHFPFFGPTYLSIKDWYNPSMPGNPFFKRRIELEKNAVDQFEASDLDIAGNWSGNLGSFAFTLDYSDADQDGFKGNGNSSLLYLTGAGMASRLDMKSRGACISINPASTEFRSLTAGPVANLSSLTRIWGCACLEGDQIKRVTIGGEVTNAANVSVAVRTASSLTAIMSITPSTTQLYMDGEAYLSLVASVDVLVNGHFALLIDRDANFLEGEISGAFRFAEGAALIGSSITAEGEANWHFGAGVTGDHYQSVQGALSLNMMGVSSTGLGAGFYFGVNAPKSKAWVLMGSDPRYKLNTSAMPATLTGMYGYLHIKQGINLYVVSGGYEFFAGFGMFVLDAAQVANMNAKASGLPASLYLVGNLGGRIHGEILGGLVSAAAGFNIQVMGPYPASFEGSVTLEACVLWVFCGSVNVGVGMNTSDGFYIK